MAAEIIDLNSRRRLADLVRRGHEEMLAEAGATIDRILGICRHGNVSVASQDGRVVWFCNDCKRILPK